jgi:formamidopyrimidine-DNA glycosylase
MPELPEVEITKRGIAPHIEGQPLSTAIVRAAKLRYPIPQDLARILQGTTLNSVQRRAKYLLLAFAQNGVQHGHILLHLGMSGSLRIVATGLPAEKHDHVDLCFGPQTLRLRDPRRFGALLWLPTLNAQGEPHDVMQHPLLAVLGIEPLSDMLTGDWLYQQTRDLKAAIKLVIMDGHRLVGVGNIYASESLFRAGISPKTPAGKLSRAKCEKLAASIKETLKQALAAGGSSLRDFIHSDGSSGYFQLQTFTYGREGQPCRVCATPILMLRQGQRASFYCPTCQK